MSDYDLVIVGAGSGNSLLNAEMADWKVAIVEASRFGGTCLNRGCLPTKMFVYAADVAQAVRHAARFGIEASLLGTDWAAIRDRVFGRIDPIHHSGVEYRRSNGVDVFLGEGRFVGPKVLRVGDDELRADRFVIAVGARPAVPDLPGLHSVPFHTSDSIMRLERQPRSMIVLGGGYIASELSHVFEAFGTDVTIVNRGERLLAKHDSDISERFTSLYRQRFSGRSALHLGASVEHIAPSDAGVAMRFSVGGRSQVVEAETLLVATGRVPNSDRVDARAGEIATDSSGRIVTDDAYRTSVPGVLAFGDVANRFQLKHLANAEARVVAHNLVHPDQPRFGRFDLVPSAVFADPQVASVGATEDELRAARRPFAVGRRDYGDAGYGWALEDRTSFVKVLVDPSTRKLLGAHIIGPQASTLVQPLLQAMCLGNTADEVARDVLYIHPALTEVVEQALLEI